MHFNIHYQPTNELLEQQELVAVTIRGSVQLGCSMSARFIFLSPSYSIYTESDSI